MLGLYIYTLIIGHTFCKSIINKLTLQKELIFFVTNNVLWTKSKNTTTTKQKVKHKNTCRNRELNPRPFAHKADA